MQRHSEYATRTGLSLQSISKPHDSGCCITRYPNSYRDADPFNSSTRIGTLFSSTLRHTYTHTHMHTRLKVSLIVWAVVHCARMFILQERRLLVEHSWSLFDMCRSKASFVAPPRPHHLPACSFASIIAFALAITSYPACSLRTFFIEGKSRASRPVLIESRFRSIGMPTFRNQTAQKGTVEDLWKPL